MPRGIIPYPHALFCTVLSMDSADEMPEGGRLGAARMEGVIVKYRLTPQPHDNVTTPSLTGISVELRNCLSVLVPDLTERGTPTPHPIPALSSPWGL